MQFISESFLWIFRFALGACAFSLLNIFLLHMATGGKHRLISLSCSKHPKRNFSIYKYTRYFITACTGGSAFVLCCIFYGTGAASVISLRGLLLFLFLAVVTEAALIDRETQTICDQFPIIIFLLGIFAVRLFPETDLPSRLIGIVVVSAPMLLLSFIHSGFFGGGDIKLMAACGWLLGWRITLTAGIVSVMTGGIFCAVMLAAGRMNRKDHFAFGPFLALGLCIAIFMAA